MKKQNRRAFINQASCLGLGYLTFMNSLLSLKAMGSAASRNTEDTDDYKAVVCILLAGGNDSYNMLIPYDQQSHNHYVNARSGLYTNSSGLAIPRMELSNTVLDYSQSGLEWAIHPSMTGLKELFDTEKLAFLANVGTLTKPTTRAQYELGQHPLGLYSHSDQIQQWQTGIPNERSAKGWAGKIADILQDCNSNDKISMNVSLSGSNIFQTGNNTVEYAIDPFEGPVGIEGYDRESDWMVTQIRTRAIDSLIAQHYQDIFESTYMGVIGTARDAFVEFNEALQNSIQFDETEFPDNYLGNSLEMIARTIDIREELGFKRQVFFVVVGGWDHHNELINSQNQMLGMVSDALHSFQSALGPTKVNVEDEVATMIISEFGRTLRSNQLGSDHAWGGNVFIMGGPVNGKNIYGSYPSMDLDNSDIEVELGRFIPTTSTDEYFGEIAKWFGVPNGEIETIFPNINEFYDPYSTDLPIGFLNLSE